MAVLLENHTKSSLIFIYIYIKKEKKKKIMLL